MGAYLTLSLTLKEIMFDEILQEFAKPSWWIGVVVVGFAINLASAYAKPFIDNLLGRFWLRSKRAAELKHASIVKHANELLNSPELVVGLKLDILIDTLRAVFYMAMAILSFVMIVLTQNEALTPLLVYPFDPKGAVLFGSFILLFIGGVLFTAATVKFTKSFDKERVFLEYQKLKDEKNPSEVP